MDMITHNILQLKSVILFLIFLAEGEVQCVFVVPEEERERVVYDIDFKREELTEE